MTKTKITMTMLITMSLAIMAGRTVQASPTTDAAQQQAEQVVIDAKDYPSPAMLTKEGPEYSKAFDKAYRLAMQQYLIAYEKGVSECHLGESDCHFPTDRLSQSGYRAGRRDAQQGKKLLTDELKQSGELKEFKQPATENSAQGPATVSDDSKQPTNSKVSNQDPGGTYFNDDHSAPGNNQTSPFSTAPVDHQPNNPQLTPKKAGGKQNVEVPSVHINQSQRAFINHLAPLAKEIGHQYDLYPSVIIAQAALESNWGQSQLAAKYHNLFGVKADHHWLSVLLPTTECDKVGRASTQLGSFRKYDSEKESLLDYANTLCDPLYNEVHRSRAKTWRQATAALNHKYATDPHYSAKLNAIIQGGKLSRLDSTNSESPRHQSHSAVVHWHHHAATPHGNQHNQASSRDNQQKTTLATIGILGGAGSFSLWGFFRHLFGA